MMKQRASATSVADFDSCLAKLWEEPSPQSSTANAIGGNAKTPKKLGRLKLDESYAQRLYPSVSDHTGSLTHPTDDESKSLSDSSSSCALGNNRMRQVAASGFRPVAAVSLAHPPAARLLNSDLAPTPATRGAIEKTEHNCDTAVMKGGNMVRKRDDNATPLISDRFAPNPSASISSLKLTDYEAALLEGTSIRILDDSSCRNSGKHQGSSSRVHQEHLRRHNREDLPRCGHRSEDASTIESSHYSGRRHYPSSRDGSISLQDIDGRSGHYSGRGGYARSEDGSVSLLSELGPSVHSDRRYHDSSARHHRGHASLNGRSRGGAEASYRDRFYRHPYDPHRHHQDAYMAHSESRLNYDYNRPLQHHPEPLYDRPRHHWREHHSMGNLGRGQDHDNYYQRRRDDYYYDRDPYYEEGPSRASRRATDRYDVPARHGRRRASDSYGGRYSRRQKSGMYPEDRCQKQAPESYRDSQRWTDREMRREGSRYATLRRAGTFPLPLSEQGHHSSRPRHRQSQVEGSYQGRNRLEKDTSVEQSTPGAFAARSLAPAAARRNQDDCVNHNNERKEEGVYLEVAPGVEEKLRGTEETKKAVESDFYDSSACWGCCTSPLFCIADVAFFVCPTCKCVSPLEDTNRHIRQHGVGLAFTRDTLVKLQEEIAEESRLR